VASQGGYVEQRIDLVIDFDASGAQVLVWREELYDATLGSAVVVEIDAHTGKTRAVAAG
jgi:hypothetical protein